MQPLRFQWGAMMPTTLTLKNIPDTVYQRLKTSAEAHRRSINSEAIMCLETVLNPAQVSVQERLMRARHLRSGLGMLLVEEEQMDADKRAGRL